ncbi:MAG TPA: hypothetical protein VF173_16710 [Thermoanaerobaculia bacterium]|nr:hypothetical protein [Thermoanaerobaculia bacterium]
MAQDAKQGGTPDEGATSRMTVDLTPEFKKRLESLTARTYLGNKATVIRHALTIFEYLVEVTERGGSIVVQTPSGEKRPIDRVTLALAG